MFGARLTGLGGLGLTGLPGDLDRELDPSGVSKALGSEADLSCFALAGCTSINH